MACTIIIAAAGAGKTERLIREALADPTRRVLITTYTIRNTDEITSRIIKERGVIPTNIHVERWFTFLLRDTIKPYQASFTEPFRTRAIDFNNQRPQYAKRGTEEYYYDQTANLYQDTVSDLACLINERAEGKTIRRLEELYDLILIDEMQDLASYDLEFLDLMIDSTLSVIMVGDPRQATYATSDSPKNKQYRGFGLFNWIEERRKKGLIAVEHMNWSHRCNHHICNFADALFPNQPATQSLNATTTPHDGIFFVFQEHLHTYTARFEPMVLRWSRTTIVASHLQQHAANIGEVKGCTFDRVLIYPTQPMLKYLKTKKPDDAGSKERLYVATTRARHSVAFVITKAFSSPLATAWHPEK